MQRLARAHANCIEGLPVFGGLLAVAIMTSKTEVTNRSVYVLLVARIVQSTIHLISNSEIAVTARFLVFVIRLAIAVSLDGGFAFEWVSDPSLMTINHQNSLSAYLPD